MSQVGIEHSSSGSQGSGLTFVRPLPKADSVQSQPTSTGLPREDQSCATRLFPNKNQEDSGSIPPVTGLELGHFVIEERIGRGGMGAVFRAIDKRLDRVVALKVLSPHLSNDSDAVQRFQNEARAAARLDHDNIARVHYIGEENGMHFIAFEFVTGTNVRNFIVQKGRLSPDNAINYTLQIAEALRHTAAANVVHRDIKPSNIIISPTGRAKLVDLGLARHQPADQSHDLTIAGTALGTFDYISPEQAIDARKVDVRSDIYSLGCTLYHMLTGEPPYPKGTMFQKVMNHHSPTPPEVSRKNPQVSDQLSRVVQKMMASNPDERYASPDALIHDLVQIAQNLGLSPTDPDAVVWTTPLYKATNPYWDGTRTWMAVALVLLLLVYLVDRLPIGTNFQPLDVNSVANSKMQPAGAEAPALGESQPFSSANQNVGSTEIPIDKSLTNSETLVNQDLTPQNSMLEDFPSQLNIAAAQGVLGGNWKSAELQGVWNSLGQFNAPDVTTQESTRTENIFSTKASQSVPTLPEASSVLSLPQLYSVTDSETGEVKTVDSLSEAFRVDGDQLLIEIQSDESVIIQKDTIRLGNKRVILRAAENVHPLIRFDIAEELALKPQVKIAAPLEIQTGGVLEVYGVDFELVVDSETLVDEWTLLKLDASAEFSAGRSSFTINNPEMVDASLILLPASDDANISETRMPGRMSGRPTVIEIQDSICRGQMDLIRQLNLHPVNITVEETAVASTGSLYYIDGSQSMEPVMMAEDLQGCLLSLKHVTGLLGQGMLTATSGDHGHLETIEIDMRDSVLRLPQEEAPMIRLSGHLERDYLTEKLSWRYQTDSSFVQSFGSLITVETEANFYEPEEVALREIGASLKQIVNVNLFEIPSRVSDTSLHTLQTSAFLLRKNDFQFTNPAIKSSSDGRNAGVDWTRSGLRKSLPLPFVRANDSQQESNF